MTEKKTEKLSDRRVLSFLATLLGAMIGAEILIFLTSQLWNFVLFALAFLLLILVIIKGRDYANAFRSSTIVMLIVVFFTLFFRYDLADNITLYNFKTSSYGQRG